MIKRENNTNTNDRHVRIAKLLAAENIDVSFERVSTASFELESRKLTLPIFAELSDDVYPMMIAHEIGHALYTLESDWTSFVGEGDGRRKRAMYGNIVEDARIERMIKRRFPGVVKEMSAGYQVLHEKNFFGLGENENLADRRLIDRINLHFKSYGHLDVPFSADEMVLVEKVEKTRSFADVAAVATEIAEFEKQQEEQKQESDGDEGEAPEETADEGEEQGEGGSADSNDEEQSEGDEESSTSEESAGRPETETDSSGDESSELDSDDSEEESDTEKNSSGNTDERNSDVSNDPWTSADNDDEEEDSSSALEKNIRRDAENGDARRSVPSTVSIDAKAAEALLPKIIITHKEFYNTAQRISFEAANGELLSNVESLVEKRNRKYVSSLVREFEMKKAASKMKRASTSKSGVLSSKRLHEYRYNDDLFKRNTVVPEGQNHGMIMLVDFSASMGSVINRVLEQVYNLITFCEKVNIPYRVYAFSNVYHTEYAGHDFNYVDSDLMAPFRLLELATSEASTANRRRARKHIAASCYISYSDRMNLGLTHNNHYNFDRNKVQYDALGGTPLLASLLVMPKIIRDFQAMTGVEKTVFMTYTDGGSNDYINAGKFSLRGSFQLNGELKTITDNVSKQFFTFNDENRTGNPFSRVQSILTERIGRMTGARVVGFHIFRCSKTRQERDLSGEMGKDSRYKGGQDHGYAVGFLNQEGLKLHKTFQEAGIVTIPTGGYDDFSFVDSRILDVENQDTSIENHLKGNKTIADASTAAIGNAFIRGGSNAKSIKFLVRSLIGSIA